MISERIKEIGERPGATFADVAELASGQRGRESVLRDGDLDGGLWWASQAQGLIYDVAPVEMVLDRVMSEAEQVIGDRLQGLLR